MAVLLRAMARSQRRERLFVTGSGNVDRWRAYARGLGLGHDRVTFLGVIPRSELLARLRAASLLVLPSFMESCPYSLIEAMALGKPIVASCVPGVREMVSDGVSALLVPPGEPGSLSSAINRLLEDEVMALRLGATAADVARERFTSSMMCSDTLQYFERVLAAS